MIDTHEAYSDESGFPAKRYHVLAVVSGSHSVLSSLRDQLRQVLDLNQISELKWEGVRTHRPKVEAARRFLQYAIQYASRREIRIDTLLWDTRDSRHAIPGRDDVANLQRMYYKVLVHAARQWHQSNWAFFPDEQSVINWREIQEYLNKTRLDRPTPGLIALFRIEDERRFFQFKQVVPQRSCDEPLVQLADLFAGLSAFSRGKGGTYRQWLRVEQVKYQLQLFDDMDEVEPEDESSIADRNRFIWLNEFDVNCKKCKLGVSLKTKNYLWTPCPNNPINFWNYEPQHEMDKAPTR